MGSHCSCWWLKGRNGMSASFLEDIKALTVNALMPSFPDDSRLTKPESKYT